MDIYFDKAYGDIYEKIENGDSCEYIYKSEYGTIKHVYIKRRICIGGEETEYYDITTPYGYGGPVAVSIIDEEKLWKNYYFEFDLYCQRNSIVSEFVRFHLFDNAYGRNHFNGEVTYVSDNIIRRTDRPIETIWREYENKVRKNVKKAISYELSVFSEDNANHLDDFLNIYYKTMNRNNAASYYYFDKCFFLDLISKLNSSFRFFYVMHENQIISTELILIGNDYCYSFLGGTCEEFYNMRPNDYLKHEIISWCVENKKKAFVLGGGYHKDDGIFRYKKAFAPTEEALVPFYVGKKVHNKIVYEDLVDKHRKLTARMYDKSFFPEYRSK